MGQAYAISSLDFTGQGNYVKAAVQVVRNYEMTKDF